MPYCNPAAAPPACTSLVFSIPNRQGLISRMLTVVAYFMTDRLTAVGLNRSTFAHVIQSSILALALQSQPYHTVFQMDRATWPSSLRVENVELNGQNRMAAIKAAKSNMVTSAVEEVATCIESGMERMEKCQLLAIDIWVLRMLNTISRKCFKQCGPHRLRFQRFPQPH